MFWDGKTCVDCPGGASKCEKPLGGANKDAADLGILECAGDFLPVWKKDTQNNPYLLCACPWLHPTDLVKQLDFKHSDDCKPP